MAASENVGEIIEVEYIDADGDRVLLRVGPRTALALCQALHDRLQEWADAENDNAG